MIQKENSSEEIDLSQLFSRIYNLFHSLKNKISYSLNVFKKRIVLILILFFVGLGIGSIFFYTTKPTYTTCMTLISNSLSNQYCHDLIQNLGIFQLQGSDLLSKQLNINKETAEKIVSIKFSKFDSKMKEKEDSLLIGFPFRIVLSVYDPSIIDTMQSAIINYLENNDFALKKKYIKKQNLELLNQKLDREMIQLDSLKSIVAQSLIPKQTQVGFVMREQDPVKVYQEEIGLYREKLNINSQIALINNIQVIDGFIVMQKPDRPLRTDIFIGGIIGLILGCYFALRREKKAIA